jgi:hypothetical protein
MTKQMIHKTLFLMCLVSGIVVFRANAQEPSGPFTANVDIVSSYLWRGSKFGSGPAFQPSIGFTTGGLTMGIWGSVCVSEDEAAETDIFLSYQHGPVTIGTTGYYYPVSNFFNTENHAFELNSKFESGIFSLSANCILNEGAGAKGGDLYFEAGLKTGNVNFFAGAGNGWHTLDSKFYLCNLGLSASKEIRITGDFSLPLTVTAVLNPDSRKFYISAGIHL